MHQSTSTLSDCPMASRQVIGLAFVLSGYVVAIQFMGGVMSEHKGT